MADPLEEGQHFDLGQGATLEVLGIGSRGAVLLLSWGDFSALLPLGLDFDILEDLDNGWAIGPVDLLLLADNAYAPLNPSDWIENLDPAVLWLSDGTNISQSELTAIAGGRTVLDGALRGWLRVATDGRQMWLESEK